MSADRSNGIVVGIVCDLDDPEKLGRVRVKYPHLNQQESDWARVCAPMAGKNRGAFFRPDVQDEVLVALEHGDVRRPYILGAMWSTEDTPPPAQGQQTENNWRFVRSRSGHQIILDDTPGKEQIVLVDKDGKRRVVIDSANRKIQVVCDEGDVEVKAPTGKVDVQAQDVAVKATASVKVEAVTIEIKASGTMTIEAQASLSIKAPSVSVEGTGQAEFKAPVVSVNGSATTQIKGGLVTIN